jgi:hypothetical protein
MIFGKSHEERSSAARALEEAKGKGLKRFAWFPTRLTNGRNIWLEHYYVYKLVRPGFTRYHESLYTEKEFCEITGG